MRFAFSLALILTVAACAAPNNTGVGDSGTVSTMQDMQTALKASTEPPKYGGTIVVPSPEGPKTMNPYFSNGVVMSHAGRPLFDNLVIEYQPSPDFDPRGTRVEPMLAERWEMPDDKTVLFHIRRGVKFHNGDTLDADDVIYSMEYARDPKNSFPARASYRGIDKIEKVDQYTVRLALAARDVELFGRLTNADSYILSKEFLQGGGDPAKTPVGTGPFRQTKFDPNVEVISVRFDDYWQKGKPYLDGHRVPFGLDRSAILAAFATRKIDSYNVTDKIQFDEFQRQVPDLRYYVFHGGFNYGWYPNVSKPPLSDLRVRRALQLAIDRQGVNEAVMFGLGLIDPPGSSAGYLKNEFPQSELLKMPGWRQPKDQDIAEAKRLLQEAGHPNGFKVRGSYISTFTSVPQIAEVTATQLKQSIGVEVELVPMEAALWFDAVQNKGEFDLTMGSSFIGTNPDRKLSDFWYSKGPYNKSGINDPRLDDLILRAKSIEDEGERKKLYADAGRILMDQAYYMSTADTAYFGVIQSWVHNLYGNFAAQSQLRKPAEVWMDVDKMPQDRRTALR